MTILKAKEEAQGMESESQITQKHIQNETDGLQ